MQFEKLRNLIRDSPTLPIVPYAVILWQYFAIEKDDTKRQQDIHEQPVYVQAQMLYAYSDHGQIGNYPSI